LITFKKQNRENMQIVYPFIAQTLKVICTGISDVLDLGCGEGFYEGTFPCRSYTGLDLVAPKGENYIMGDMSSLPFPNDSFDVIFAVASMYFVGKPGIEEAHRVLKPNGILLVFDYNRKKLQKLEETEGLVHPINWSRRKLRSLLRNSGFKNIKPLSMMGTGRHAFLEPFAYARTIRRSPWVIFKSTKINEKAT